MACFSIRLSLRIQEAWVAGSPRFNSNSELATRTRWRSDRGHTCIEVHATRVYKNRMDFFYERDMKNVKINKYYGH
jgi:hypothetical protein